MIVKPDPFGATHRPFLAGDGQSDTLGLGCMSCYGRALPVGRHRWLARLETREMAADPDRDDTRASVMFGHLNRTAVEIVDIAVEHSNFEGIVEPDDDLLAAARKATAKSGNPVTGLRLLARRREDDFMSELRSTKEAARLTAFLR